MKKILTSGFLIFILSIGLIVSLQTSKANALGATLDQLKSATYNWVNEMTISATIGGSTLTFVDPSGIQDHSNRTNYYQFCVGGTAGNACPDGSSVIFASSVNPGHIEQGSINYNLGSDSGAPQSPYDPSGVSIGDTGNADIIYTLDGTTISRVDGNGAYQFTQLSSNKSVYKYSGGDEGSSCLDAIVDNSGSYVLWEDTTTSDPSATGTALPKAVASEIGSDGCVVSTFDDDVNGPTTQGNNVPQPCDTTGDSGQTCSTYPQNNDGSFNVHIGGSTNVGLAPGGGTQGNNGAPNSPTLQCLNSSSFALNWIVCPVVEALQQASSALTTAITNELTVDVSGQGGYFDQNPTDSLASDTNYQLWTTIRVIALSLLVIIALVMVIAQALDVGPFDAYTIRKILPRILIAVILISFSWELGRFLVSLSDGLGTGVTSLLALVTGGNSIQVNAFAANFISLIGLGATGVAALALGPVGLLLLLVSAVLALLVGFAVILLRRVILIICVVTAPIAFIAFILPGTQRVWKLWREAFTGAIILFPIITGAIGLGKLFAYIEYNSAGQGEDTLAKTLLSFVFYFAPFFFLPKLAQMSGGAMGAAVGALRNATSGSFERLKKGRQNERAKRRQLWNSGLLYSDRNRFTKRLADIGIGVGTGARGNWGFGEKGRTQKTLRRGELNEENLKQQARLRQLGLTDDNSSALLSLSEGIGKTDHLARIAKEIVPDAAGASAETLAANEAERRRMVKTVQGVGVTRATAQAAAINMVQNKARSIPQGAEGIDMMQRHIKAMSGGDEHYEKDMAQTLQYYGRLAGRPDIGGDWTSDKVVNLRVRLKAQGVDNESIKRAVADVVMMDALGKMDMQTVARGHPSAVKQVGETLNRALRSGDPQERLDAAMNLIALQKNLSFAVGDSGKAINQAVADAGIDFNATRAITRDKIDRATGQPVIDPITGAVEKEVVRVVPVTMEEQLVDYVKYENGDISVDSNGNHFGHQQVDITADDLAANARTYDQAQMRDVANQQQDDGSGGGNAGSGTP